MPDFPPHIETKRIKTFIRDGVELFLKKCEICSEEVYLDAKHSLCEKCRKKKKG